jgi:integrase
MNNQKIVKQHLMEEQVEKLQDHLKGHHLEAIIRLALVTGLRRDELLSLRWPDIDLDKGEVHFQDAKTTNRESLSIPDDVTEILKHHLAEQLRANVAWSEFVFPAASGVPLNPRQQVQGFDEVLEQAELPRISFHQLRMTVKKQAFISYKEAQG